MKKPIHTSISRDQVRAVFGDIGDPVRIDFGEPVHVDFSSRWDVTWGPSVNLNPTRWERLKARVAKAVRRMPDAYAVAMGRKIALHEDEYWGDC
ncbi:MULTISPECIES: hypothetical protein [Sphingomonas]|uniref:hypothetical protein n=1 Tax=Sphingomonas TaxID=13687 RepID=UPI00254A276D|nr:MULTISPECIES: hypothetical protein [Sphingomonas]MDK8188147.1 hypothetical protein [Sphingomonas zeae]MDK8217856.1 hypothetical protein [Sphingomonas sp. UMB7805-LC452B]